MVEETWLGDEHTTSACTYIGDDGMCSHLATVHIVWTEDQASNACDEHAAIAATRRDMIELHQFVAACFAPDSLWFPAEHRCRHPLTTADYQMGVVLN